MLCFRASVNQIYYSHYIWIFTSVKTIKSSSVFRFRKFYFGLFIFFNLRQWSSVVVVYEPFVLTKFWNYYFFGAIILLHLLFLFMSFQKEARKFHIILYLCS